MVEIQYEQLQAVIALFIWPFFRISSFIVSAPLLGHKNIPIPAKVGFSVLLTLVMLPVMPAFPDVAIASWAGLGIIIEQIVIGLAIGTVMRITFTAVQSAGEFISLQMGIGFATFFSADSNSQSLVISRLFYMLTLLIFLALNGHLFMIEILASTFRSLPIASLSIDTNAFKILADFGSVLFSAGLMMALPVTTPLLIVNITMGILNRSAPQFSIFSIGFPMSLTIGMLLLVVLMSDLGSFLENLFYRGFSTLDLLLKAF
jgi:flagellar biosynthetic protein FliR